MVCASQLPNFEYDFVWLVAASYDRDLWARKLIVALAGYIDGSGSHGEDDFILAGYVMSVEKWIAFNTDWINELKRQPAIEYFHAKEVEGRRLQFEGFSDEFCKCKINDLASIIDKHQPAAIYSAVHWDDYKAEVYGRVPKEIDDPYYILFFTVIQRVIDYQRKFGMYERVDFTFDKENEALEERILSLYPKVKATAPPDMHGILGEQPIFRDDKEARPLQAADLYAWHLRRSYVFPEEERHKVLAKLMGSAGAANYYTREQLARLAHIMENARHKNQQSGV